MGEFFGNIYSWFESFYGTELCYWLWGHDGVGYNNPILFWNIGLINCIISLCLVLCYYYVINHPRFNRWGSWMCMLLLNAVINIFVGYGWAVNNTHGISHPDFFDANNEPLIGELEFWGFGCANAVVATMAFILFSFVFKWWSRNCKHSPIL